MDESIAVKEIVEREFVGVSESDSLASVADLLVSEEADSAVVLRGNDAVGVLTARDALGEILDGSDPAETPVSEAMSRAPLTISGDATLREAEDRLVADADGGPLVVAEDDPVGVLTERGLLTAMAANARNGANAGTGTGTGTDSGSVAHGHDGEAEYATQSICEDCGSLTQDLAETNGRLVCPNCRGV